ncbi:Calcium-responsive transcription factor [Frankliniella fusca]|uniref:Calcium-responsive transcription factor n=1 Tax=Frankliniella fusca TaxID=407009 RepID=A0AAE1LI96_9NEOP|nr:Calcium-responsive transcription factor [Frankliniella fusca]
MADLSSEQVRSVDKFIKEKLKSCNVSPKGMITGYVESKEAYDELMRDLTVLGCRFSVRSTYSGKTEPANLQYKILASDLQIPFTGTPFHVDATTYYLCTHGFRYFKSKVSNENENEDENGLSSQKKRHRRVNESIKIGCQAKMLVKCIRVYPDYKTTNSWRRKCDLLKKLKADLQSPTPPRFELHFWIAVSQEDTHNHERHKTLKSLPLHPDLIAEIHNVVRKGVTSIPMVKSHLVTFVDNMFRKSSVHPDQFNSAFYPNDKCVYNHIHEAKILAAKLNLKIPENNNSTSSPSLPSTDVSAPRQEHPTNEKCPSDLAVVPELDTFTADWQDQPVLPTNIVQVLNNNGTLMLMVTQPLSDQVPGGVEHSIIEAPPNNIVNLNLDDNIYTVITDASEQRILQLNTDSNILMTQQCSNNDQIEEVLSLQNRNENVVLNSEKTSVSGVIMQSGSPEISERDADDTSCHEDPNQFLFVGDDSQTELLGQVKGSDKEFSTLCTLPPTQSTKDDDISLFPTALSSEDCGKNLDGIYSLNIDNEILKKSRGVKRTRKQSEIDVEGFDRENLDDIDPFPSRKILREHAQDIINMSYSSTNTLLLQEMVQVFEKYRKCLHEELEMEKKMNMEEELSRLPLPEKSGWKTNAKSLDFTNKSFFDTADPKNLRECENNSVVIKKLRNCGNAMFSSSDSSVDEYDDLVIND